MPKQGGDFEVAAGGAVRRSPGLGEGGNYSLLPARKMPVVAGRRWKKKNNPFYKWSSVHLSATLIHHYTPDRGQCQKVVSGIFGTRREDCGNSTVKLYALSICRFRLTISVFFDKIMRQTN